MGFPDYNAIRYEGAEPRSVIAATKAGEVQDRVRDEEEVSEEPKRLRSEHELPNRRPRSLPRRRLRRWGRIVRVVPRVAAVVWRGHGTRIVWFSGRMAGLFRGPVKTSRVIEASKD